MARRFRGSEEVKVDAKGRVSIPAKFRRVFEASDPDWQAGKRAQLVIVYGTRDWNWLQLFTIEAMEEIEEGIARMPRGSAARNLLENIYQGHADEAEIDGDGRLVLPQKLREKIGLTDSAFFISAGDSLKVWTPEAYAEEERALEARVPELEPGADPLSLLAPAAAKDEG
ncbi:division/cell wall cluster transcriptional repressor MraZ [Paracoccus sp. P2]|uniref:Transcriptional regulator MraZ n=1 Tax=Paracoccus pantotrophus TaxID=82367 RepID=A0A1I5EGT8_PARPN|nr:division/cell wall cluster transcriptional repressor MraZ [Paracoccus pantotrophus]MDF3853101.1 division/cell wall cluster transcriptional repressor MraZ [Paracoccus pantotrophus]QFG36987.1 division/cell wall cluster transcriptional repressor MraZ [Paracoccus pantotrophus]QLH14555.1 division/cell wall cluster transcriptional repressor MraZ [Paracoccus pantotrophus]RDD98471.1 transcriptional regulator MraZ [Paracoccus pantotrophus]RKS52597.1 division/cell wall cluster transcriptional repress